MTNLEKDVQRQVKFQDGKTYVVRLRAGIRPMLDFREKGHKEWTSITLEEARMFAIRSKLQ